MKYPRSKKRLCELAGITEARVTISKDDMKRYNYAFDDGMSWEVQVKGMGKEWWEWREADWSSKTIEVADDTMDRMMDVKFSEIMDIRQR